MNTLLGDCTKQHKIPSDAYVLIIGAMKCGTTSLFSYMSVHPSICQSKVKEPGYFSKSKRHKTFNGYRDLWKDFDSSVHKYVLEASTNYTKYPVKSNVPENIRSARISPKFIYIMRNPFDRIVSHVNHRQSRGQGFLGVREKRFINASNYYLQLERYRRYFPIENMLLLDFDELTNRPQDVLRKVYNFLDLPLCLPERYDIKNESLPISPNFRKLIELSDYYFPEHLRKMFRKLLLNFLPKQTMYALTSEDRAYIHGELEKSMLDLYSVYGVNVQKWGFTI